MKKIFMMLALCLPLIFAACGDKNEDGDDFLFVDYAPVEFYISLENYKGVDLLNAENEGAVDVDAIKLFYEEKTYVLNPEIDPQATRAYFAHFEGMKLQKIDGKYCIYVGEFDGSPSSNRGDFAIEWGDGSRDYFSYTNVKVGKYDVDHNFFHNGKPVKSGKYPYVSITVIK